jgi:hypothetical protein
VPAPKEAQEKETGRVVLFPTRISLGKGKPRETEVGRANAVEAGVADLKKYEQTTEPDDYPRRMMINLAAFAFIVVLTLAGIWIVEQLALLRKQQDCVLSGRRNCADIEWNSRGR